MLALKRSQVEASLADTVSEKAAVDGRLNDIGVVFLLIPLLLKQQMNLILL